MFSSYRSNRKAKWESQRNATVVYRDPFLEVALAVESQELIDLLLERKEQICREPDSRDRNEKKGERPPK